jgi:BASS family bile acid:Na+ symporter
VHALAFVGRHATKFMAGGVLVGFFVPPLAALARPLLVPALVIPLTLALIRLDWTAIAACRRRAGLVAMLVIWILGVSPVLVWAITTPALPLGLPPGLREALILMAASSPIVSSVAIALFVGLDASLAVVAVVLATALVPFTLPPMALALLGIELSLGLPAFMGRLAAIVGAAFVGAWLVRRVARPAALAARGQLIDGLAVVNLVVFAVAIMDGVTAFAIERPGYAALATGLAFLFNLLLQAAAWLAFRRCGAVTALTAGLLSGNCNMGLVLVAISGYAGIDVTAFFALAQLPMYMLPMVLDPLYRSLRERVVGSGSRETPTPG